MILVKSDDDYEKYEYFQVFYHIILFCLLNVINYCDMDLIYDIY